MRDWALPERSGSSGDCSWRRGRGEAPGGSTRAASAAATRSGNDAGEGAEVRGQRPSVLEGAIDLVAQVTAGEVAAEVLEEQIKSPVGVVRRVRRAVRGHDQIRRVPEGRGRGEGLGVEHVEDGARQLTARELVGQRVIVDDP